MSWQFLLSFDDGANWADITDLVKNDSVKRKRTLHNDDFEPVQDSLSFSMQLSTVIATDLLGADPDKILLFEAYRDGNAFFIGYLRPVTEYAVTDENDAPINEIDVEVLDNSHRLQNELSSDKSYTNYTVMDPNDTSSSLVHALLSDAGYSASEINITDTISYVKPYASYDEYDKTYGEILAELLDAWGYVYYFTLAGIFEVYQWRGDAVPDTPSYSVGPENIINELKVEADDPDDEQYDVSYYDNVTEKGDLYVNEESAVRPAPTSGVLYHPEQDSVRHYPDTDIPDNANVRVFDNVEIVVYCGYVFVKNGDLYGIDGWMKYYPASDTYESYVYGHGKQADSYWNQFIEVSTCDVVSPKYVDLQFSIKDSGYTFSVNEYQIKADITYYYRIGTFSWPQSGSFDRTVKVENTNIENETEAKNIAKALKNNNLYGRYRYSFKSEADFPLGEYTTVSSTVLNFSTTARITKRVYSRKEQSGDSRDIVEYEAIGVAKLITPIGIVAPYNKPRIVDKGDDYVVSQPISSNDMNAFEPGESPEASLDPGDVPGLFFTHNYLGFWDGSAWTAYIFNDGTFKFLGDANNYIEWDGSKLHIEGDMFLSGDSELQGTVTTGNGIQSDNYVAGSDGWQIDGDGNAEFNNATVRGTIEADVGAIGGWDILANEIRSNNDLTRLRSSENRLQIDDALGTAKVGLGYLGNLPNFTANDFGLYIADGNTVSFESGASFEEGSYFINSDAAFVAQSGDSEAVRLGSLGTGDIGLDIGGMLYGEVLGGGGATGTFDSVVGGGSATGAFGVVRGGGNAEWASDSGLLYSLAEDKLYLTGTLVAADGEFSGSLTVGAFVGDRSVDTLLTGIDTTESDLSSLDTTLNEIFENAIENGTTIIQGGVIKTSLLNVTDIFAQDINVDGTLTMDANGIIQSDDYSAGSAGWKIDNDGIEISNGTFRGSLDAASGTFAGQLDAATGNFESIGSAYSVSIEDGDINFDYGVTGSYDHWFSPSAEGVFLQSDSSGGKFAVSPNFEIQANGGRVHISNGGFWRAHIAIDKNTDPPIIANQRGALTFKSAGSTTAYLKYWGGSGDGWQGLSGGGW